MTEKELVAYLEKLLKEFEKLLNEQELGADSAKLVTELVAYLKKLVTEKGLGADLDKLKPNKIYRPVNRVGREYFGFGPTQLAEKIKSGEVPKPFALTPGGRAKGWYGWQILEHQRRILEAATKPTD